MIRVHITAEPHYAGYQCCRDCGQILSDSRNTMGQINPKTGKVDPYPFWASGAYVGQSGGHYWVTDADERILSPCV